VTTNGENKTMDYKIEQDSFSILNYMAIELLEQLNCLKPSEKLVQKAESLLSGIEKEDEKHSI
jgi:hypothetical protein